jgi:hypothetical protein
MRSSGEAFWSLFVSFVLRPGWRSQLRVPIAHSGSIDLLKRAGVRTGREDLSGALSASRSSLHRPTIMRKQDERCSHALDSRVVDEDPRRVETLTQASIDIDDTSKRRNALCDSHGLVVIANRSQRGDVVTSKKPGNTRAVDAAKNANAGNPPRDGLDPGEKRTIANYRHLEGILTSDLARERSGFGELDCPFLGNAASDPQHSKRFAAGNHPARRPTHAGRHAIGNRGNLPYACGPEVIGLVGGRGNDEIGVQGHRKSETAHRIVDLVVAQANDRGIESGCRPVESADDQSKQPGRPHARPPIERVNGVNPADSAAGRDFESRGREAEF